jgi:hypothetical protein
MEHTNMSDINHKVVGDQLIITVDIGAASLAAATVSKSSIIKAMKAGLPAPTDATLVATSCGFQSVGKVRYSLNVSKT